jgi:acetyltransferase-like isoleucine patch superfamily enzyme
LIMPAILPHDWFPRALPQNVEIGEGSWLYSSFAFLHCRSQRSQALRIGRSCGVYNGSFFDLGPNGEVKIGDFSTVVGVIFATNGHVRIGNYCFLAHEVVIADGHATIPWRAESLADRENLESIECVTLGDDVWVGAGAVLLKGARIGDGAVVGAGTVVDFEVPPRAIVAGNPARIVGAVSPSLTFARSLPGG